MSRALVAVVLSLAAVACSDGARVGTAPTTAPPATAGPTATPTPTPSPTPPDLTLLDGLCMFVGDGSPEPLPPLAARALGVPRVQLDDTKSARYANAEVCLFTPPGRAAPWAKFFTGRPDRTSYAEHSTEPSRVEEPTLPGGAYSYATATEAAVLLLGAEGVELTITVGGLGAAERHRAAARRLIADVLRLATA